MSSSLSRRAVTGVIAIALGQAAGLIFQVAGSVILARRLGPTEFGTFAIVLFLIALVHVVSDFGQGTVLVQRPQEPRAGEWRTAFTLQLIGAASMALLLQALARPLAQMFNLGADFVRALAWSLPLVIVAPLERVSSALLERRMAYGALSVISLVGGGLQMTVAVILAWSGFGLWSLVVGALAAGVGRALVSLRLARWPLGFGIERAFLGEVMKRGRYCQLTDLLGFLREQTPPLIAGPIFGPTAVGYLVWARNLTYVGHYIFASAFTRVGFSLMARAWEGSPSPSIGRVIEGMVSALTSILVVLLMLLLGLAHPVVAVVYTEKWAPALAALYLFGMRMLGGGLLSLFVFLANGMGQFRLASRTVAAWAALEVGLALVLAPRLGFSGIAAASALAVWPPAFWLARRVNALLSGRGVRLRFGEVVGKPVIIGGIVGGVLHGLSPHISSVAELIAAAALGGAVYVLAVGGWSEVGESLFRRLRVWPSNSSRVISPLEQE